MSTSSKIEQIIETARSLKGTPYKYGAKMEEAPQVFDCSGFVKYVFGTVGVNLPRSTIEQAAEGAPVEISDVQPGDLVFVRGSYGHYNPTFPEGIGHVGIYTPERTVIHAASQRINHKPIIEEGAVVEHSLEEYVEAWKPLVAIRRFIR